MKSSFLALGLVGSALVGLWYFAGGSKPLPVSQASDAPKVAAPFKHENLSVYFVHGSNAVADAKVLSLQEGLESESAIVHETGNVNVLAVENRSPDHELFIQSGDIVKGGRQDRMVSTDVLLPPNSGVVSLPVNCVEHDRWTNRGEEDAQQFKSSAKSAAGNKIMYANLSRDQSGSWQNVKAFQDKLCANLGVNVNSDASPSSFQLTLESPVLKARVAKFEAALKKRGESRDDIIGVVFVVNGQVSMAEVYGSNALFRKAWPKLLSAAAVEAIAERTDKATAAPPSAREVELFLARAADPDDGAPCCTPGGVEPEVVIASLNRHPNEEGDQVRLRAAASVLRSQLQYNRYARESLQTEGRSPDVQQTEGLVQTVGLPSPIPRAEAVSSSQGTRTPTPNTPVAVQDSIIVGNRSGSAPSGNPDGNRLNSNRVESNSTLMVESRDPNRKNAVIHKSYIKK